MQDALGDQTSRSFGPLGHRGQRWWFRKITDNQKYRSFMSKSYYSMTGDKPVASAYGIIKNQDGIIVAQSEKNKGTTFTIYLPASDKPVSKAEIAPGQQFSGTGTILLIDDEDMILDVGKTLLEKLGYEVLVAAGGSEGLEIYRQNIAKIDLVILDMIMPEMNGSEAYERLIKMDPRVKVLLSSGYAMDGVANDIFKQRGLSFIQKPFDIQKLSHKVREAIQKPAAKKYVNV